MQLRVLSLLFCWLFFFSGCSAIGSVASGMGWVLLAGGAVVGVILIKTGTPRVEWNLLYVHILLSLGGAGPSLCGMGR